MNVEIQNAIKKILENSWDYKSSNVTLLRPIVSGLTHRPRKVMLFVNPIGGKKKGVKIWEKDVQPLMTIAGIETKMIVTERTGHIRDTLLTADLSDLHVSPVLASLAFLPLHVSSICID